MSVLPKIYAARPGELEDANNRHERLMDEAREIVTESVRVRVRYAKRTNQGRFTGAALRWLERFDDHLVSEGPDDTPGSVVS